MLDVEAAGQEGLTSSCVALRVGFEGGKSIWRGGAVRVVDPGRAVIQIYTVALQLLVTAHTSYSTFLC